MMKMEEYMRKFILCLCLMAAFIGAAFNGAAAERPDAGALVWEMDPRVEAFHSALLPYGEWFKNPQYGWSWAPYNVSIDWRPYTQGRWLYTDYGWMWDSYWPWGWACFHYGRWYPDDSRGWSWCPDTLWAPAWCAWRMGDDWIAWAALPPEALWIEGQGLSFGEFAAANNIAQKTWCFVEKDKFLSSDVFNQVQTAAQNPTLFYQTSFVGANLQMTGRRLVNEVPSYTQIQTLVGHPVDRLMIRDADSGMNAGVRDNEVWVYRLRIKPALKRD